MPKLSRRSGMAVAALFSAGVIALFGCRKGSDPVGSSASAEVPMVVAAGIYPIADVVREVGGRHVQALALLPAGRTPHGYEPPADLAEELAAAKLLVVIGPGVDDWARQSAAAAGRAAPKILELGAIFASGSDANPASSRSTTSRATLRDRNDHTPADGGPGDPHIWLDPLKMVRITDEIAKALAAVAPAHASDFAANADQYKRELHKLHELCANRIKTLPRKEFVTFHAAYGHFARLYGLEQIVLPRDLAEGSQPETSDRIVAFIKRRDIKAVFATPQFPVDRLDAVARQTGISVDRLDPLGAPDVTGYDSYIELMKTNLATLVQGLSK